MKFGKIVILVAAFILSFLVSWLFLFIWWHNPTIVAEAPYDVNVPGKPLISAKVYSLKQGEYLLVLTDAKSGRREGYWFCPNKGRIGIPSFQTYLRLGNYAVISKNTLDGFTYLSKYNADWEIKNNNITFTIKGPSETTLLTRELLTGDLKRKISYGTKVVMETRK
jgi:hypothetical protein